ncbi:hypothetical protein AB0B70_27995, partial [Microbispora bryophytorum]
FYEPALKRGPMSCGQPRPPGRTTSANPREPSQAADRDRTRPVNRLIALSIGEVRRLFNLIGSNDHTVDLGLYWSEQRRSHQARARRHHFRRHLRLQVLQI